MKQLTKELKENNFNDNESKKKGIELIIATITNSSDNLKKLTRKIKAVANIIGKEITARGENSKTENDTIEVWIRLI